jgi:hypothetical protein
VRVRVIHGTSPTLGEVEATFPEGLVAVVGSRESAVRAFVRLLRRGFLETGGGGESAHVTYAGRRPGTGVRDEDLAILRAGPGEADPAELLRELARALARVRGGSRIDRALGRMAAPDDSEVSGAESSPEGRRGVASLRQRLGELRGCLHDLRRLERGLGELRARHAEVVGDVEEARMSWLRERQDAETHLQAYRDRARELKVRLQELRDAGPEVPCPTCGRTLAEHHEEVVEELREEWESVVQDGSWWRRRREQLELKPEALQEVESTSLRVQAAMEERGEALERARSRVREMRSVEATLRELGESVPRPAEGSEAEDRLLALALTRVRRSLEEEAREEIVLLGSRILARITGTRLLGFRRREIGLVELEGASGRIVEPGRADRAAASFALRVAATLAAGRSGDGMPGILILSREVEGLEPEERYRAVSYLGELRARVSQIVVVVRDVPVEPWPDLFDAVLELPGSSATGAGGSGPGLRSLPAGRGPVRVT